MPWRRRVPSRTWSRSTTTATLRFDYPLSSSNNVGIVLGGGWSASQPPQRFRSITRGSSRGAVRSLPQDRGRSRRRELIPTPATLSSARGRSASTGCRQRRPSILGNSTSAVIVGDNVGSNSTALLAGTRALPDLRPRHHRGGEFVTGHEHGHHRLGHGIGRCGLYRDDHTQPLGDPLQRRVVRFPDQLREDHGNRWRDDRWRWAYSADFNSERLHRHGDGRDGKCRYGNPVDQFRCPLGASGNGVVLNGGTLQATGSSPWGTSRSVTLGTSTIFTTSVIDVQNTDAVSGFTISSPITGGGTLRKIGPGILTFRGANT